MATVRYKKIPLWKAIRKIISPRLASPGLPVASEDGDPFILSEDPATNFQESASWKEALHTLPRYISYSWKRGGLKTTAKFMAVGATGLVINLLIVKTLVQHGTDPRLAGIAGTLITIFTNFLINDAWTFYEHRANRPWLHRLAGYYTASLGTMLLQIALYEAMVVAGSPPAPAVVVSVALSYVLRLIYIRDHVYLAGR